MIRVERLQDVTIVALDRAYDSLREDANAQLSAKLTPLAESIDPPLMVLDLTQTERFGSIFLEIVIRAWKRLSHRGGKLAFSHLAPLCAEVFQRTNLDEIWPAYATNELAVAALKK